MVPDFATMWHKLRGTVQQEGLEVIVEPTVQRWFSEDFKAAHPEVLEKIRKMIRGTTLEGYMGVTAAFLGLDLEDRLPGIRAQTLFVSGAEDKLGGPPELMKGLSERVKGAQHVSVPNAAHIANIQNPEGFNRVLTDFLGRKP
jgi:3-oxoadipate enol-lactonase